MKDKCPVAATPAAVVDLPPEMEPFIAQCRLSPHPESHLIEILHRLQQCVGYLRTEHLDAIAQRMQIPTAKVTGVATFYHLFTFVPRGKHAISVCLGTACFVKGSAKVLARIKDLLHVEEGRTSEDGLFSLQCARCVGACALAPVVIVDDKVYGNVRPEDVPKILVEYGFDARAAARRG